MRNGNESGTKNRRKGGEGSSYPTYEEWKQDWINEMEDFLKEFLSYL